MTNKTKTWIEELVSLEGHIERFYKEQLKSTSDTSNPAHHILSDTRKRIEEEIRRIELNDCQKQKEAIVTKEGRPPEDG